MRTITTLEMIIIGLYVLLTIFYTVSKIYGKVCQ